MGKTKHQRNTATIHRKVVRIPATQDGQTYTGRILNAVEQVDSGHIILMLVISLRKPANLYGYVIPHVLALTADDEDEMQNTTQQLVAAGIKEEQVAPDILPTLLAGRTVRFTHDPDAENAAKQTVITGLVYTQGHKL